MLTRRKRERRRDQILEYIIEYAIEHTGNTPSLGEIARAFGIGRTAAYNHTIMLCKEHRGEWRDGEFIVIGSEFSPPVNTR